MPAVSKAQQKFMGMVHAAQKGEEPASPEVAKVAKSIGKKDAKDFASTKHKGLPSHVKEGEEFPDEQPNSDDLDAALPSAVIPNVSAENVLPKRTNEILWKATGKVCEGRPFVERVRMYEKKGGGWRLGKQRDEQIYNNLKEFYTNEIAPRKEAKSILVKRRMGESINEMSDDVNTDAEKDHEVSMAKASLLNIARAVQDLQGKIGNEEKNLPGWIQDHITNSENYIVQASKGFHELEDNVVKNQLVAPNQVNYDNNGKQRP